MLSNTAATVYVGRKPDEKRMCCKCVYNILKHSAVQCSIAQAEMGVRRKTESVDVQSRGRERGDQQASWEGELVAFLYPAQSA